MTAMITVGGTTSPIPIAATPTVLASLSSTAQSSAAVPDGCSQAPQPFPDAIECKNLRFQKRRWKVVLPTILRATPSVSALKVYALQRGASTVGDASTTIDGKTWIHLKDSAYQGWVQRAVLAPAEK
jgi:hypothetical protein